MATDDAQQPDRAPTDRAPTDPAPTGPARTPGPAREVTGYRTPRYPVFLVTGAVLGLLTGVGLAVFGGSTAGAVTSGAGVLGYFVAFGVILGALAGGTLAVLVESLLNRGRRGRARRRPRPSPGGTPPR